MSNNNTAAVATKNEESAMRDHEMADSTKNAQSISNSAQAMMMHQTESGAPGGLIDTGNGQAAAANNMGPADDNSMPTSVEDDQNYQFYKEYCRLYYANIILTNRLQQLLNEKKDLQFKLSRLESNRQAHEEALGMTFDITDERRKRHRRTANEIQRHYVCPVEDCPKSYGSEGSLNQHQKIKHPEFYQAQIQASNAQQHIVSGVISTANGQKVVGLPTSLTSGSVKPCKTESGNSNMQLRGDDDDDDDDDEGVDDQDEGSSQEQEDDQQALLADEQHLKQIAVERHHYVDGGEAVQNQQPSATE